MFQSKPSAMPNRMSGPPPISSQIHGMPMATPPANFNGQPAPGIPASSGAPSAEGYGSNGPPGTSSMVEAMRRRMMR